MLKRLTRSASRLSFLLAILFSCFLSHGQTLAAETKPNVVLVMCDDLGWGDVGFNGSKVCKTPHLDEMAASGLKFTRFYAAAPVCSPTRGSAITGRHPYRYGIPFANTGHMKKQEVTLAEALKTQGYTTGHFGKWHLGTLTTKMKDANRGRAGNKKDFSPPWKNGFDVCFSTESKVPTWNPLAVPKTFGPGESRHYGWIPVEDSAKTQHYGTHYWSGLDTTVTENMSGDNSRITMDRAVPFIETAAKNKQPFLAIVWFHTPHLPVVAGKKYRDMYADRSSKEQLYFGCITAMDEQVGRLREMLRALDIADDTIVCFASDNGPENGTPGSAGHLRGRKRSLYEGGVRVPGIIEWPAKIREARTTDIPAVTSDYFPTVLDVLGFEMKGQPQPIDGVSLLPLIHGKMTERPRPIGFQSQRMRTLTDNRYKLVVNGRGKKPELYDLVADPSESKNIASEHAQVLKRMETALAKWQASCAASAEGKDYR